MGALGIILYYLASGNLLLALVAGTCTQGDAGRLWGGLISLILYGMGSLFLLQTSQARIVLVFLIMPFAAIAWATYFTAQFIVGFWFWGRSACDSLDGTWGQMADGSEALLTVLWAILCLFTWSVLIGLCRLAWKEGSGEIS